MTERTKAFFINGGAGRVLCSIPALEKYAEEVDKNFIVVCEGGTDFYRGHPILHSRCYDHWHKNLFEDKLVDCELLTPEPYRVWEYFNQKCSIAQAYDIPYYTATDTDFSTIQGPAIVEIVCTVQERFPKISNKAMPDGTFKNRPYEDMYPFLDQSDLDSNMFVPQLKM